MTGIVAILGLPADELRHPQVMRVLAVIVQQLVLSAIPVEKL